MTNVLKTIGKDESPDWISKLFMVGPHKEEIAPLYPPQFPINGKKNVVGSFFYLVYGNLIVGYGKIKESLRDDPVISVGAEGKRVNTNQTLVIDGPLKKMPYVIHCRGFQGIRYIEESLHEIGKPEALAALKTKNLKDVW